MQLKGWWEEQFESTDNMTWWSQAGDILLVIWALLKDIVLYFLKAVLPYSWQRLPSIEGQTVLITGSGGYLGRQLAVQFAELGCKLVVLLVIWALLKDIVLYFLKAVLPYSWQRLPSIEGQTVLITGSGGYLGRQLAVQFAELGCKLVVLLVIWALLKDIVLYFLKAVLPYSWQRLPSIEGQTVLITGSGGYLGRQLAVQFAELGCKLVVLLVIWALLKDIVLYFLKAVLPYSWQRLPSIEGQTVLITGSGGYLGRQLAVQFAELGCKLVVLLVIWALLKDIVLYFLKAVLPYSWQRLPSIEGQTVLITGSGGYLGRQLAVQFAELGCKLVVLLVIWALLKDIVLYFLKAVLPYSWQRLPSIEGQTVLITGSGGYLGRQLAVQFAELGCKLVVLLVIWALLKDIVLYFLKAVLPYSWQRLPSIEGQTVLITGSGGYLGRQLAVQFAELGCKLVVLLVIWALLKDIVLYFLKAVLPYSWQRLPSIEGQTVLITGSGGYLGRQLAVQFAELGCKLVVLLVIWALLKDIVLYFLKAVLPYSWQRLPSIEGQTVLITGSGGYLGRQLAVQFAELGCKLVVLLVIWALLKDIVLYFLKAVLPYSWQRLPSIEGQTVLITGSGGYLGRQLAVQFAELGCNLLLVDIDTDANEDTADAVRSISSKIDVQPITCDLTLEQDVSSMVRKVKSRSPVDILVLNAGMVEFSRIQDIDYGKLDKMIKVNCVSQLWLVKSFLPEMINKRQGYIVNVNSVGGIMGYPYIPVYNATKFFSRGYMESLHCQLIKDKVKGVHVITVCPHFMSGGLANVDFDNVPFPLSLMVTLMSPEYTARQIISAMRANKRHIIIPPRLWLPQIARWILTDMGATRLSTSLGFLDACDKALKLTETKSSDLNGVAKTAPLADLNDQDLCKSEISKTVHDEMTTARFAHLDERNLRTAESNGNLKANMHFLSEPEVPNSDKSRKGNVKNRTAPLAELNDQDL